jgi:hypothetical protein
MSKEEKNMSAYHPLISNFNYFFKRLNPSPTFEQRASSQYQTIKSLIEDKRGPASILSPICFLQGSYRQATAIYTINDIDMVALCELWHPGETGGSVKLWSRDEIFDTIAAPLKNDGRYRNKVRYNKGSMCIKVDLDIKVEILPFVYKHGNNDPDKEPFRLWRPEKQDWEDGYARYHQFFLTWKNQQDKTEGNFIPTIKVLKHLRSRFSLDDVSFHIECLLFRLNDELFKGGPADYMTKVLVFIASISAEEWYKKKILTPCQDRDIFVASEWTLEKWKQFHYDLIQWATCAKEANQARDKDKAIDLWQLLLGKDFFPRQVSQ